MPRLPDTVGARRRGARRVLVGALATLLLLAIVAPIPLARDVAPTNGRPHSHGRLHPPHPPHRPARMRRALGRTTVYGAMVAPGRSGAAPLPRGIGPRRGIAVAAPGAGSGPHHPTIHGDPVHRALHAPTRAPTQAPAGAATPAPTRAPPAPVHGPALVAPPVGSYVATTVYALRLRRGPRLAAPVIETLASGTLLRVRGYHVSWMAVTSSDGLQGYVMRYYVQPAKLAPPVKVTAASMATRRPAHAPHALPARRAVHVPSTDRSRSHAALGPAATVRRAPVVPARPVLEPSIGAVPSMAQTWARTLNAQTYPRLANYNGLYGAWQIPFFVNNDVIVARRGAPLDTIIQVHPHALALLYERTLQVDLCCTQDLYGLDQARIPPGWWLTEGGSRLTRRIDAATPYIFVADPRPFAACQDVLVGGESMHVYSVYGHTLYVSRGYYSTAAAHRRGAPIAPHYSYRKDLSNCSNDSLRPWSFNLSSLCPRWHGQTWADYLAHYVAALVRSQGWRGVFYDNLTDFPADPRVDVARGGRPDGGVVDGVNVWRAGERVLLAETRRLLPGLPLLVNGDLVIDGVADGREMEGFPTIPGAAVSAGIDAYLADSAAGRRLTIVNPDTNAHPYPSFPAVQLAVGAGLLGDGYTAYDYGWLYHGYPWWFDEYDGGVGSATTAAVDYLTTVLPVAHPARFNPGDVVLVDQEAMLVLRVLDHALLVQRGAEGTLADSHPAQTVVSTAAQRMAGRGYLGQALDSARIVPTVHWPFYPLPVWLDRGPARVDGHPQRVSAQSLRPETALQAHSTVHYDAMATRLALLAPPALGEYRTLVFSARGPAGQSLWIGDGHTAVPLVLRPTWHRYVIPIGSAARVSIGLGRVGGTVAITGVRLLRVQGFLWRRDFTRGMVLVNSTDMQQRLHLDHPYQILAGDQNPLSNSGRLTCTAVVERYRAVILLNAAPGMHCVAGLALPPLLHVVPDAQTIKSLID